MSFINTRIRLRYDTQDKWEEENPILLEGELAVSVLPTGQPIIKVGDGKSCFKDLHFLFVGVSCDNVDELLHTETASEISLSKLDAVLCNM